MNEIKLQNSEIDYLLSPKAIRDRAQTLFSMTEKGQTCFKYNPEKLQPTIDYLLKTIHKNYPSLEIPFHSRWGHFKVGGSDRIAELDQSLKKYDAMERARIKLDLVITSVLLDAGAGATWKYVEEKSKQTFARSEGLGVASLYMFYSGVMSSDRSLKANKEGLLKVSAEAIEKHFQVSASNPLVGVEGRAQLLRGLGTAVSDAKRFKEGRPGNIIDFLVEKCGKTVPAPEILRAVLDGFGPIWPGRIMANGINLGDVWKYSKIKGDSLSDSLVPLHKLSQWMTYSLIEPIVEAGITVTGVENLTGLAEYRNGGFFVDSGLIEVVNPEDLKKTWEPDSDFIIEWRALTVHLLDRMGSEVQKAFGKKPSEFPLAKVLEGGTWWAGRFLAAEKRPGGQPPIQIKSDGTVF